MGANVSPMDMGSGHRSGRQAGAGFPHEPQPPVSEPRRIYPVGLLLSGRRCLVVGGGKVAARKISGLLACGASVTVVAPRVHEAIAVLATEGEIATIDGPPLEVQVREYRDGEAAAYSLVVTATGDSEVDERVSRDAKNAGVWVNSADDPARSSFILPAVARDGAVSVAVSTSGTSPALATWLRDRLAEEMPVGSGEIAALLAEARQTLLRGGASTQSVDWHGLLEGALPSLVAEGRIEEARTLLEEALRAARE